MSNSLEEIDAVSDATKTTYAAPASSNDAMWRTIAFFIAKAVRELRSKPNFIAMVRSGLDDGQFAVDMINAWSAAEDGSKYSLGHPAHASL